MDNGAGRVLEAQIDGKIFNMRSIHLIAMLESHHDISSNSQLKVTESYHYGLLFVRDLKSKAQTEATSYTLNSC